MNSRIWLLLMCLAVTFTHKSSGSKINQWVSYKCCTECPSQHAWPNVTRPAQSTAAPLEQFCNNSTCVTDAFTIRFNECYAPRDILGYSAQMWLLKTKISHIQYCSFSHHMYSVQITVLSFKRYCVYKVFQKDRQTLLLTIPQGRGVQTKYNMQHNLNGVIQWHWNLRVKSST